MNTTAKDYVPVIQGPYSELEIILEKYEFCFPKWQLKTITDLHNKGKHLYDIAKIVKRKDVEVLLALVHLAEKGKITRPMAFWNGSGEVEASTQDTN